MEVFQKKKASMLFIDSVCSMMPIYFSLFDDVTTDTQVCSETKRIFAALKLKISVSLPPAVN